VRGDQPADEGSRASDVIRALHGSLTTFLVAELWERSKKRSLTGMGEIQSPCCCTQTATKERSSILEARPQHYPRYLQRRPSLRTTMSVPAFVAVPVGWKRPWLHAAPHLRTEVPSGPFASRSEYRTIASAASQISPDVSFRNPQTRRRGSGWIFILTILAFGRIATIHVFPLSPS
jgi:hypothetical protein